MVTEAVNGGTDTVQASIGYVLTANIENLTLTGSADINGTGNDDANSIIGNIGNNTLDGGVGADTMTGGAGNDIYVIDNAGDLVVENANEGTDTVQSSLADYTLTANVENLTLTGSANINGTGNNLDNTITGNSGDNTLDGGTGADTMTGGAGNDTYIVDDVGDVVVELANGGIDTVQSSISYTLSANVENLVLTGSGNISANGNGFAQSISGNSGDNTLEGGTGPVTMSGGLGNDTYVVSDAANVVVENANEGTDTVESSLSYTLGANVENLTLTGVAAIDGVGNSDGNVITGNDAANTLTGLAGNDVLDGGLGNDSMIGGLGDDMYVVDSMGDTVVENVGEGIDMVDASISYQLGANIENLMLLGSADLQGYGNELANTLTGNAGSNLLDGGVGADAMFGGDGNDAYFVDNAGDTATENANEGTDSVYSTAHFRLSANIENLVLLGSADLQAFGNSSTNVLYGNAGDNLLDGDAGTDAMYGGAGNDAYMVDNAGDVVIENANEGIDTVYSTAHLRLGANVENLILQGSADLQGYGNSESNAIYGNDGNNILDGGVGADSMYGGLGNDVYMVDNAGDVLVENLNEGIDTVFSTVDLTLTANVEVMVLQGSALQGYGNSLSNVLYGNAGNNILDGGAGADAMFGGAGDDIYYVDNPGDVVVEGLNEGTDVVFSSINYGLTANVETLVLQGSADLQGYGNAQANSLFGNSGNNLLDGGAGADSMMGGAGNDVYIVDDVGDLVFENLNEGTDAVFASVNYSLTANVETLVLQGAGNLSGTGNALDNRLFGNAGDNILDGGAGADRLTGGAGNDTFVFNALQANGDTIVDFAGNGAGVGDSLSFVGFGTAGDGATFTQVGATNQWVIHSGLDAHNETITLSNSATVHATDFLFS